MPDFLALALAIAVAVAVLAAVGPSPLADGRPAGSSKSRGAGSVPACGPGSYRDAATCKCLACPRDCAGLLAGNYSSISATVDAAATVDGAADEAEDEEQQLLLARLVDVCNQHPASCVEGGDSPESTPYCRVRPTLADKSDLEPVGMGAAAGVVGGVCLVSVAAFYGRRRCLRGNGEGEGDGDGDGDNGHSSAPPPPEREALTATSA